MAEERLVTRPQAGLGGLAEPVRVSVSPPKRTWHGVVVPMVSPFTRSGGIDEPAVGRIVEHLVEAGMEGVFPLGTTGEAASIPRDEKRELVAATVRFAAGRATVYAGISGNCLGESVEAARVYRQLGVDAVVAHMPWYYPLSDAEIEAYFLRLADQVPLPLVLYNIPATTHHTIAVDSVERLSAHPNIVAIKDSGSDKRRLVDLLQRTGGRGGFPVLLGNSILFAEGLRHGAVGLVPSGAQLVPELYRGMYQAALASRWEDVARLGEQAEVECAAYLRGRDLGESLAMLKLLMERRGLCGRTMLPPLKSCEADGDGR